MKESHIRRTIITIGIDIKDELFDKIDKRKNQIINIIENKNLEFEKKYTDNEVLNYEINEQDYDYTLSYIMRNNENIYVICSDLNKYKILVNKPYKFKLIYYTNKNIYLDNENYINKNINRYVENEIILASDLVITSNIGVYVSKKILEEKQNIYFLDDNKFDLEDILKEKLSNEYIKNLFMNKLNKCTYEYEKSMYLISAYHDDLKNCIEISNYIYQKYNDKLMYMIYIKSLKDNKDYQNLIYAVINNSYFTEDERCELLFLNSIKEYDLMEFMIDLFITNYESVLNTSQSNITYKQAMYNYEMKNYEISYEKHMELVRENSHLINSPLLNRNISFIMYINKNDEYEKFDYNYKSLLESII